MRFKNALDGSVAKNLTHQNEGCITRFFRKTMQKRYHFACLSYFCSNCMLHLHFLEFFATEPLSLPDHKIGRLQYNPLVTRYHATDHNSLLERCPRPYPPVE